jgi:IS1 family transposase
MTQYTNIFKRYDLKESLESVRKTLVETREIDELNLNVHKFARFKRKILSFMRL